ncbi:MAG: hypothetical protein JNK63_04210 [Chthonomonas sp.]|nr:hypothetical protein [Chthonomonas sp.]
MPRRFAAADIGSNTVHLLVGEITNRGTIRRVVNVSEWLSLGEIVSKTGTIPSLDATKLFETLRRYKRIADDAGVERFYVFATEAMRVAENHDKLITEIRKEIGIKVDLITSSREAELSLLGIGLDTHVHDNTVLVEVGGGSAQVALCQGKNIVEQASLPIGTGRLIGEHGLRQPAPQDHLTALRSAVQPHWQQCAKPKQGGVIVASGGVARGIMRALHPDGERMIQFFELEYLMRSVAGLPIDEIVRRFRVKEKRAGSLLPGSVVFYEMLEHYQQKQFLVSEFGVREGAILEMTMAEVAK